MSPPIPKEISRPKRYRVNERVQASRVPEPLPRGRGLAPAYACRAALALFLCAAASAQSNAIVARASGVTGQALLTSSGAAPVALTPGFILSPGDRIDTRAGGRVVIDLSDGSMVVVSPGSVVTLKDFRAASSLRELF